MASLLDHANAFAPELVRVRRDLHRHPELSFQEVRTAGIAARQTAGLGYAASQLGLIRASGGDIVFGHRTTIEMFVLCLPLIVVSLWELSRRSAIGRVVVGAAMAYSVAIHGYVAWIDLHPSVSNALAVTYDRAMAEHRQ